MSSLSGSAPSLPSSETLSLLLVWTSSFLLFFLTLLAFVAPPYHTHTKNDPVLQTRRAMLVLKLSILVSIGLTISLFYLNTTRPAPLTQPITSFRWPSSYPSFLDPMKRFLPTTTPNVEDGKNSWNYSICRPIFGLLISGIAAIVDSHKSFRAFSCIGYFVMVGCDALGSYDITRATNSLITKCSTHSSDCLHNQKNWDIDDLDLAWYRDMLASGVSLYCLLVVCFLGVCLGFTYNRFDYTVLHPKYSHENKLGGELKKHKGYSPGMRLMKKKTNMGYKGVGLGEKEREKESSVKFRGVK